MTKLKNWIGLCAMLLSLQAYGNDINIQDAWIRTLATGQEDAMVGMVINSSKPARITAVISPAYKFVAMQGPGKGGANKIQELEFIALPAQTPVTLSADGTYLLLSGNKKTLAETDKIPVIVTVRFDDGGRKTITAMAQPVNSKGEPILPAAAPVSTTTPAAAHAPDKAEAKADTPAAPVKAKAEAKPAAPAKPAVAEAKPAKAAPAASKPAAVPVVIPVAATVAAAPLPAPVAAPAPAPVVEPKKAPEAKPAEQPKKDEASSAECASLALQIRECEKENDMMQEWCMTNAKSKSSCQLSLDQVKKLRK